MSDDWKTLRVPEEAYDDAKEQKEANDRTWGEQIVRPDGDDADQMREVLEMLDRLPNRTAENVVGQLEDLQR